MRQGFYTHSRIMEEPGEEDSPHQITQWHRQASLTTQWVPRGPLLQHLAQEALVC